MKFKIKLPFSGRPVVTAFLMVGALLYILSCKPGAAQPFYNLSKSPLVNSDKVADAVEVQSAFNNVYSLYEDRVVYISTEQTVQLPSHPFFNDPTFREYFGDSGLPKGGTQKRTGLGSGFIISEDGYIVTNNHVVKDVDKVSVKIGDTAYDAKIVGADERTDIALLKIDPKEKLNPVFLGDSDTVKVGDWAIAIGNPFGLDKTFTTGVISAVGRKDVDMMGGSGSHIQTDASINPGNSGGPLINVNGEVIGINRMIYSQSGGNMGIGFAIPINRAKVIFEELKEHGKVKRGYLGVQIVPLTKEYSKQLGLKSTNGALVGALVQGSPAQKGGLQVGDVILSFNGVDVKTPTDLVEEVGKAEIGKTYKTIVWRNKKKVAFFLTIKERP